jgi:hypothetical protein
VFAAKVHASAKLAPHGIGQSTSWSERFIRNPENSHLKFFNR